METEDKIFAGNFNSEDIEIKYEQSNKYQLEEPINSEFEKLWGLLEKEAKEKDVTLFNGESYALKEIELQGQRLILTLGTLEFKHATLLHKIDSEKIRNRAKEILPKSIFLAGILKTTDNFYIFGERGNSINSNQIDCIGGVLSKSETNVQTAEDIFDWMITEMEEEIGVGKNKIKLMRLIQIILTDKHKAAFIFQVNLCLTKEETEEAFKNNNDQEMDDLIFIKSSKLVDFLNELGGYKEEIAKNIKFD